MVKAPLRILFLLIAGMAFLACGDDDEDAFVSIKEIKISPDKSDVIIVGFDRKPKDLVIDGGGS